jgi:hypothetical protein
MVLAIPGGRGLFSVLQEVLKRRCDKGARVRLTHIVHSVLQDFRWLATDMAPRPTRIAELIPACNPATLGAQDSLGLRMGCVHFPPFPMERFNLCCGAPSLAMTCGGNLSPFST